ncbi:MAG: helix-turn-helix transcriptional regulator [Bacilli bacterium]|nr:helix-turn-helix transcriptional regulator [Bacilli bacterium]
MFSNPLVIDILNFLDQNIYRKIAMDELAEGFHYNKDYIMRIFKKEIQATIIEYINYRRIFNSLYALKNKDSSILSIALSYGFSSQEYYCEIFHHVMSVSPSDYRLFLNYSIGLNEEIVFNIQDRLSFLDSFFKKVEEYKRNIPPKNDIKMLSIFR